MGKTPISLDTQEIIRHLRATGLSYQMIGGIVGCSPTTAQKYAANVETPATPPKQPRRQWNGRPPLDKAKREQIRDLHYQGITHVEIAQIVGCAVNTVTKYAHTSEGERYVPTPRPKRNTSPPSERIQKYLDWVAAGRPKLDGPPVRHLTVEEHEREQEERQACPTACGHPMDA